MFINRWSSAGLDWLIEPPDKASSGGRVTGCTADDLGSGCPDRGVAVITCDIDSVGEGVNEDDCDLSDPSNPAPLSLARLLLFR